MMVVASSERFTCPARCSVLMYIVRQSPWPACGVDVLRPLSAVANACKVWVMVVVG